MEAHKITYPCKWTYALLGKDEEALRLAVGEIVKGVSRHVAFSKQSEKKNYVSLHVEIEVSSEEERNRYFTAFQSDPRVAYVL